MPNRVPSGYRRVLLCLLAAAASGVALWAQENVFRADVRLVRLLVTVKDATGALVGSLEKGDFTLYDNEVKQEVAVFEHHTAQPLSVALLVDISGSTAREFRYEFDSVGRFLKALFREGNPNDAAALYTFNWRVYLESNYTRKATRFDSALRKAKPEGGTSLYDAIYLAANDAEARDGRRVLVVVTDGGDTTSTKDFHAALEAAHLSDAVIYSILVMPITNDAGRNIGGENALATLAERTGGRVFRPGSAAQMDAAFQDILRDLRTQYLIGYYPRNVPPSKNRFHTLRVELSRPGLRAFTRNGYYGSGDTPGER